MSQDFSSFLFKLRDRESGISIDCADWYSRNLDVPVFYYPRIQYPGRLKRSWSTGRPIFEATTVREYFKKLGVLETYYTDDIDKLKRMQYASVNPWGFIGYQIGEAVLYENGYYIPERASVSWNRTRVDVDVYCGECNDFRQWARGRKKRVISKGEHEKAIFTDVNQWRGEFSGKDSLNTLEDLRREDIQERVIRVIISNNLSRVEAELNNYGVSIFNLIDTPVDGRFHPEKCSSEDIQISMSGIAASCHLCGWRATVEYLLERKTFTDELGTSIESYMSSFHDYEIPELLIP